MTTQRILRIHATVQENGQIAVAVPALPPGAAVEVVLLLPEEGPAAGHASLEILDTLPVRRLFPTAADMDAYLEAERVAWDH